MPFTQLPPDYECEFDADCSDCGDEADYEPYDEPPSRCRVLYKNIALYSTLVFFVPAYLLHYQLCLTEGPVQEFKHYPDALWASAIVMLWALGTTVVASALWPFTLAAAGMAVYLRF